MPETLYILIDLRLFLYVCVANRHIRFRLIVVIVRNEVVHCALRKEFAILRGELSGKRLIMCDNERRLAPFCDNVRHCKSFTASRDAKERLVALLLRKPFHECINSRRLVSRRAIVALYFKRTHPYTLSRLNR